MALAVIAIGGVQAQPISEPLLKAVRKAVLTNPEVQASWNGFKAAGSEQDRVRSGFMPQIDLSASVGRENRSTSVAGDGTYNYDTAKLTLNQMLFDGLLTSSEVKRMGYAKLSRYYELAEVSESVALAALQAYIDVLRYRERVQVGTDNFIEHKQSLLLVEESARAGVRRGADVEQANGRLALAESSLVTELSNLHNASARYLRVVGEMPPVSLPSLAEPFRLGVMPESVDALMRDGLQGSPTLNAALENARAYQQAVESRRAAFMPRLDLKIASSHDRNTDGIAGKTRVQGMELTLNGNLYRGGSDQARRNQATDQQRQARELQEKACRDVRQVLSVAFSDVQSLTEQKLYKDQHLLSTEKTRDGYRQQFDIGQRTLLDLLDTQNEYVEASRSSIDARYDQIDAQARTLAGMGRLVAALGAVRSDVPTAKDAGQQRTSMDADELCPLDETAVDTVAAIKARYAKAPVKSPGSYVMLIPSPDGSVGRVTVQGALGQQVLTQDGQFALLDGSAVPVDMAVSQQKLTQDFGPAMGARPPIPERFVLYFNRGGAKLTKDSRALLSNLLAKARARKSLDIWLVGHTDTVGSSKRNDALGLLRAKTIANLFRQKGRKDLTMTVESYGESSPMVVTPDETDEPRNRRGEVTFR